MPASCRAKREHSKGPDGSGKSISSKGDPDTGYRRGNLFDQTRLIGSAHDAERCELIVLRRSGLPAFALAIHVGGDRSNDDHALHDILVVDIDAEKGESARHDTENHHANYGAPNAADSTG